MFGRATKIIAVSMLVLALGGHWAILQSVAWVKMAAEFSRDLPISEAILQTFDGTKTCNICKLVEQGKKAEKETDGKKLVLKLDSLIVCNEIVLYPPSDFRNEPALSELAAPRLESPPTPPPRSA